MNTAARLDAVIQPVGSACPTAGVSLCRAQLSIATRELSTNKVRLAWSAAAAEVEVQSKQACAGELVLHKQS